jgi:hypothetical protein
MAVASSTRSLKGIVSETKAVVKKIEGLPEARAVSLISEAVAICYYLARWTAATLRAKNTPERYLNAAKVRAKAMKDELVIPVAFPITQRALSDWAEKALVVSDIDAVRGIFLQLAAVPMPVLYSIQDERYSLRNHGPSMRGNSTGPRSFPTHTPVVKISFELDDQPLATPQAIRSNVRYGFRLRAETQFCPQGQMGLEIDYVTTMNTADYSITHFTLLLTAEEKRLIASDSGELIIRTSQSLLSAPSSFKVRARFINEDRSASTPAVVIGANEIRLRALDQHSYPVLSRYSTVDIQVPKILDELQSALPDLSPQDVHDFANCLVFLGSYSGMVQQSGVFAGKKRIDEKREFQQHLLQHMRVRLGDDVKEEETLGGGRLDLRFRNIVIELKTEFTINDRNALRKKYVSQTSQYTSSSVPLAITCILDMTEKEYPPSNIANNITLETPTVHGFEHSSPTYPTKIAVVIIDGNLKRPSDYS